MKKVEQLYEGKAKKVYATEDPNMVIVSYKDDATALDGLKKGTIVGKGIINNSKTKIILNLEDDEAERVQDTLHLSDAETMEVTHFERGNGLISTNNNNIMVEFKASPLEKDLITTDRRELREILERKRQEQSASA